MAKRLIVYVREGETAFLNVDVDVRSRTPLDALAQGLGRQVSLHYLGRYDGHYWLHFSTYSPHSL